MICQDEKKRVIDWYLPCFIILKIEDTEEKRRLQGFNYKLISHFIFSPCTLYILCELHGFIILFYLPNSYIICET